MSLPVAVIPHQYEATVLTKTLLYPATFHLTVAPTAPVPFRAGQYASILFPSHRRPFSFATTPNESQIEFIIGYKPDGVTIGWVEPLQIGDTISFLAPYGRFVLDETDTRPLLFIAGGTGVAPIASQIKQALLKGMSQPILLYFACYDQDRIYLEAMFEELAQRHTNFSFRPTLSQPLPGWQRRTGLVTTLIPEEIPDVTGYSAYVCGSPGLVTAVLAMLQAQGLPAEQTHSERFT